jgi:hypothetical protein
VVEPVVVARRLYKYLCFLFPFNFGKTTNKTGVFCAK